MRLVGFQFKLGLAILASMFLAKLNNITPEYLKGAIANAQSQRIQQIAEFFYNLATNHFTSILFNTPHFHFLNENMYGFTAAFRLINFILTYTPVFLFLFVLIPFILKSFSLLKKKSKQNTTNKSFFQRLKIFAKGVKVSFQIAFLKD